MKVVFEMPNDFEIGNCKKCPFSRGRSQCIIEDKMTNGSCMLNCFCRFKKYQEVDAVTVKKQTIAECIAEIKKYALEAYGWEMEQPCEEGVTGYIENGLYEAVERLECLLDDLKVEVKDE